MVIIKFKYNYYTRGRASVILIDSCGMRRCMKGYGWTLGKKNIETCTQ